MQSLTPTVRAATPDLFNDDGFFLSRVNATATVDQRDLESLALELLEHDRTGVPPVGLMAPAQEKMIEPLNAARFNDLSFPVVNNTDAAVVTGGSQSRDALIRQISAPVRWTESVTKMFEGGVETFVEIGPGKVLIGLVKAIAKDAGRDVKLLNVEDQASLQAALESLRSQ